MSVSDEALAAVVSTRRLARGSGPRHSFTVERSEARLRLRDRPGHDAWDWTLVLVRGLLALCDVVEVDAQTTSVEGQGVLELTVRIDASALEGFQPGMVLDEALLPDPGPGDGSLAHRQMRLRRLGARALNEALAESPRQLELVTPSGTRVIARDERKGGDPYRESAGTERSAPGTLKIRLSAARGISRWFDGLLFGREGLFTPIVALWMSRVPGLERRDRGARLRALPDRPYIALGRHARLWPAPTSGVITLLRDGVTLSNLDAALLEAGLATAGISGLLECPKLSLTFDETNVVRDDALVLLAAWLADALSHGTPVISVSWPHSITQVRTAAGTLVEVSGLLAHARAEPRELPYVWPAQAQSLPLAARPRVLALGPSELEALQREHPELVLVPASAVLAASPGEHADLTALGQGSFPPLVLAVPPWSDGGEVSIAVELVAYLHRHGAAARGSVMLIARDRVVARGAELDASLPGVTLVARLPPSPATTALVADAARQRGLAQWVAEQGLAQRDVMLAHLVATRREPTSEERVPLLRAAIDGLDARTLGLRYELEGGRARLCWREHPLAGLVVAHTRGQAPCTLGAALERAREVGGLVLGEAARRWYVLEVDDAEHATWVPTARGRELLLRVLGAAACWDMPTVPQSHPHCLPAAEQRVLLLDRDEAARQLARTSSDVHARDALLGHLLVARALAGDELGLRDVPLLSCFEPDAVQPARLRSLASVLADERVHAVVPIGTASRELPGPVIEAASGLAALLHEVTRMPLQPVVAQRRIVAVETGAKPAASRRVSVEPVLRHPIADALAAGALHLLPDGGRRGVDLWARGLRVGELELPSPLGDIAGRLWLSDAGVRAGRPAIEAMLLRQGRALVLAAQRQAELAPPGGTRRRALERFVGHCEATAAAGDDRLGLLRGLAQPRTAAVLSASAATAARLPPLRRLWLGALVRHALGHAAKLETAWLSWKLARIADGAAPIWQIELGGRHRWVSRAERDESTVLDVQLAALAIAAELLASVQAPRPAIAAAMLRVVATAHVSPRA